MKEPLSTISNLAFAAYGVAAVIMFGSDATAFLVGSILLWGGSTWFHGRMRQFGDYNRVPQASDEVAMYAYMATIISTPISTSPFMVLVPVVVVLVTWQFFDKIDSMWAIPVLSIVAFAEVALLSSGWNALILGAVALIALGIRAFGESGERWHDPAHAAWHIMMATVGFEWFRLLLF